jgi:hypothetical protein
MSNPKDTVVPGDASEKESALAAEGAVKVALPQQAAEQKVELSDSDLDKVAGGDGALDTETAKSPGIMGLGGSSTVMNAVNRKGLGGGGSG